MLRFVSVHSMCAMSLMACLSMFVPSTASAQNSYYAQQAYNYSYMAWVDARGQASVIDGYYEEMWADYVRDYTENAFWDAYAARYGGQPARWQDAYANLDIALFCCDQLLRVAEGSQSGQTMQALRGLRTKISYARYYAYYADGGPQSLPTR